MLAKWEESIYVWWYFGVWYDVAKTIFENKTCHQKLEN
jgi:hypothetical protein